MVDLYKQLLVGQNPVKQNGTDSGENTPKTEKDHGSFQANPNLLEYGNRMAEIIDFEVLDDKGMLSNTIDTKCPATLLSLHSDVTVIVTEDCI